MKCAYCTHTAERILTIKDSTFSLSDSRKVQYVLCEIPSEVYMVLACTQSDPSFL